MAQRSVKVAIIGAGSAGLAALREVRKATDDVLLIEGGPYGTTCARVGCMPSKLLIAAANAAEAVRGAAVFGVEAGSPKIDGAMVMDRVRRMRDAFVDNVIDTVEEIPDEMRLRGSARFADDNTLLIATDSGEVEVSAERVVIATGSRPTVPQEYADYSETITSDDLFDLRDLPERVAVFGGGIIGLELGQALSRLGVNVRLFGKDGAVGPLTDEAVLGVARDHLTEVMDFVPHFDLLELTRHGNGLVLRYRADGGEHEFGFDRMLVAIGRTPNVDALNLSATSLRLDDTGVPEFDRNTCQCGDGAIFIAGDANDEVPLLHEAVDSGKIAGANAVRYPDVEAPRRHTPLTVVYCEPQIAMVGRTRAELEEAREEFVIGAVDWSQQGRARMMDEAVGRLQLYAEPGSARLLGAEMFGPRAENLAHFLAFAINHDHTLINLMNTPIYHPTFEEGLVSAIEDALAKLGMADAPLPYGLGRRPGG